MGSFEHPPELLYTVTWSRFHEPLLGSLLRPKFLQLSKNEDADTTAFLQSVSFLFFSFSKTTDADTPHRDTSDM